MIMESMLSVCMGSVGMPPKLKSTLRLNLMGILNKKWNSIFEKTGFMYTYLSFVLSTFLDFEFFV